MSIILACLDLSEIFCDVDDFYQVLERVSEVEPKLPYNGKVIGTSQGRQPVINTYINVLRT